jgi:hypothetical protein
VQSLRVNNDNGSVGYCVNNYGGVFWGQNFGWDWSPVGDWAGGAYKGECQSGEPLIGISEYTASPNQGHAVLCASGVAETPTTTKFRPNFAAFPQNSSCSPLSFDGRGGILNNYGTHGNWDPGSYVGECAPGSFVAGVSQSTSGRLQSLLCCPGNGLPEVATATKEAMPSNVPGIDWDYTYWKAQCQTAGQYIIGVSATPNTGATHAILCATP